MRIGLLTHQWPGVRLGGIGAYTLYAAETLARAGHAVHLFTLTLPADARTRLADKPGITVHEVKGLAEQIMEGTLPDSLGTAVQSGGEAMHRLAVACLLSEEVLRVHFAEMLDVIEAPDYEALGLPLIVGGPPQLPVITHIHSGSAIAREVGNLQASREQTLRELLELAAIEGGDAVCAPSQQVLKDTRAAYGRDDLAANAEVLPLPFEPGNAAFTPPPPNGPVLYIGRLEWLKGTHLLAQAANEFLTRNPTASLRLAGPDTMTAPTGGSMAAWMKNALDPGIRDSVQFLGEQTREQITGELRAASFVVIPSLRESYSYVCCEALAAGRPVVVSEQTAAAEVAGEAGLIFARGDSAALAKAMDQMWRDPAQREKLGKLAWDRARTALSGEDVTSRRVSFYKRVAISSRSPGAARLAKVESIDWIKRIIAAIHTRDADALVACVTEWGGITTPGMRLVEVLTRHGTAVKFHLYGAGRHTARLLAEKGLWEAKGHTLVGLIDDHPRFQQTPTHLGLTVISCATAEKQLAPNEAVILSTDAFEDQFWQQTAPLRARGIAVHRLYGKTSP